MLWKSSNVLVVGAYGTVGASVATLLSMREDNSDVIDTIVLRNVQRILFVLLVHPRVIAELNRHRVLSESLIAPEDVSQPRTEIPVSCNFLDRCLGQAEGVLYGD